MISSQVSTKMGALFRLRNVDKVTGEVTAMSGWDSNIILNAATAIMETGFTELPVPKLGSSIVEADVSQLGVQSLIPTMTPLTNKVLWAGRFTRTSNNMAVMSWGHQYTYRNNAASASNVSEIGIDNFNRAVFKDENGVVRSWSISPTENLIVDMEFMITFTTPEAPVEIRIVDNDGLETAKINVALTVAEQITTGAGEWWKLLSKGVTPVTMVTDANFTGVVKPAAISMIPANLVSEFVYVDRNIMVDIQHRAPTGGQQIKGMLIQFGCLAPNFGVVFSTPIHVGSGYTFKSDVTISW